MCIDSFEMKLIWKNDASKRTEMHFIGMRIRAADCNDSIARKQFIPFAERGGNWMMRNEFRKKRVERAVQFGWDQSLEFAKSIPKFDAGVICDRPIVP